jgi:hypothetical protein
MGPETKIDQGERPIKGSKGASSNTHQKRIDIINLALESIERGRSLSPILASVTPAILCDVATLLAEERKFALLIAHSNDFLAIKGIAAALERAEDHAAFCEYLRSSLRKKAEIPRLVEYLAHEDNTLRTLTFQAIKDFCTNFGSPSDHEIVPVLRNELEKAVSKIFKPSAQKNLLEMHLELFDLMQVLSNAETLAQHESQIAQYFAQHGNLGCAVATRYTVFFLKSIADGVFPISPELAKVLPGAMTEKGDRELLTALNNRILVSCGKLHQLLVDLLDQKYPSEARRVEVLSAFEGLLLGELPKIAPSLHYALVVTEVTPLRENPITKRKILQPWLARLSRVDCLKLVEEWSVKDRDVLLIDLYTALPYGKTEASYALGTRGRMHLQEMLASPRTYNLDSFFEGWVARIPNIELAMATMSDALKDSENQLLHGAAFRALRKRDKIELPTLSAAFPYAPIEE